MHPHNIPHPAPLPAVDFSAFDELIAAMAGWSNALDGWAPAAHVRREWQQVEPRLDSARRELSRVLVVGVIGGTGTGKSTLVNALAGGDVSPAGDVARPTTMHPVVVIARDIDSSWLPLDAMEARVVRSSAPAVANIVLVDCPDPDTQSASAADQRGQPASAGPRPSDTNRNRDRLEAVLPVCDVLLLVATAQKYRSWIVAREVAAFAPGRPLLFVQTHASRDPDIRDDWRRELESQGFVVPRIFRLDALEAARRAAAGVKPESGFAELVQAIDAELVGRAARRVRRTGALDLAEWFVRQSRQHLEPMRGPVSQLAAGVCAQRVRLEGLLATAVEAKLRASRSAWQRMMTEELLAHWHGGPFAMFLHSVAAIGSFWPRFRSAGGGLVARLLAGQAAVPAVSGHGAWQAIEELGIGEADVEQSRSILAGLAARARVTEPMVGRARLNEAGVQDTVNALLERTSAWLASGIERLVAERRGRIESPLLRVVCEVLFTSLVVAVLARAGWNFFYGHLWAGRPVEGIGFLQEAMIWVILWGFFLRWIVFARLRMGRTGDIAALLARLPNARLVDPLLSDFALAAGQAGGFIEQGDQLGSKCVGLASQLAEPSNGLGSLRREPA